MHENRGEVLQIHPQFRLIGTMNPPVSLNLKGHVTGSSKAGHKAELGEAVRRAFFEIFVDDLYEVGDLMKVVEHHPLLLSHKENAARVYLELRELAEEGKLEVEHETRVCLNLRSFVRALRYAETRKKNEPGKGASTLLVDGFFSFFSANLTRGSLAKLTQTLLAFFPNAQLPKTNVPLDLYDRRELFSEFVARVRPAVALIAPGKLELQGYRLDTGPLPLDIQGALAGPFLCTATVRATLTTLARLLSGSSAPVLLEGPTSAGKTSMLEFMCNLTGHKFVRINNHEQSTLSEYLGQYVADSQGGFTFQEG